MSSHTLVINAPDHCRCVECGNTTRLGVACSCKKKGTGHNHNQLTTNQEQFQDALDMDLDHRDRQERITANAGSPLVRNVAVPVGVSRDEMDDVYFMEPPTANFKAPPRPVPQPEQLVTNRKAGVNVDDDVSAMTPPTINWAEEAKRNRQ